MPTVLRSPTSARGSISAVRHIVALAQSHGVQVNPHVGGSAVAKAASLQVIAALPVAHHSLFVQELVLEYDRSAHPFRQRLVSEPIEQVNGWANPIQAGPRRGSRPVDARTLSRGLDMRFASISGLLESGRAAARLRSVANTAGVFVPMNSAAISGRQRLRRRLGPRCRATIEATPDCGHCAWPRKARHRPPRSIPLPRPSKPGWPPFRSSQ